MKKIKYLFMLVIATMILFGCEQPTSSTDNEEGNKLTTDEVFLAKAGGFSFSKDAKDYTITGKNIATSDYASTVYSFEKLSADTSRGIYKKTADAESGLPAYVSIKTTDSATAILYQATTTTAAESSTTEFASATLSTATKTFLATAKNKSGSIVFGAMPGNHAVSIDASGKRITVIVTQLPNVPIFYDFVGMGNEENADKGIYTTTNTTAKGMLGTYAGFVVTEDGAKGSFYRGIGVEPENGSSNPSGNVESEKDFAKIWGNSIYKMSF